MSFTLLSEHSKRPVVFETAEVRDLQPGEHIHYVTDRDSFCYCLVCGKDPVVWTDDAELWQRSAVRCL